MTTIVLDGTAQLNIQDGVSVSIISSDVSDNVSIVLDGDGQLNLSEDGNSSLTIAVDGEVGVVTEVIPPNYYDTSDANLTSANLLAGKKAYGANGLVEGSMVNHYTCFGLLGTKNGQYTLSEGHVDSVSVAIDSSAVEDLIPENLRAGVNVLGVYGSLHIPNITQDGTSKIVSIL